MKWYLKVWQQYADFSGRARRTEYWMFFLFNFIIVMLFYMAIGAFALNSNGGGLLYGVMFLLVIYALAMFIPALAVEVRRLHDMGKSGWWIFIAFIPLIGSIWLLVLLCMDSQPGSNEWGKNPKEVDDNLQNFDSM